MSTGQHSPSRPQLSRPLGPVITKPCDALTALQRVSLQITHRALGQQHQLILAQVCMAAAPLLRNFTTIEPGQIRSDQPVDWQLAAAPPAAAPPGYPPEPTSAAG
jgi:hypothetical protein